MARRPGLRRRVRPPSRPQGPRFLLSSELKGCRRNEDPDHGPHNHLVEAVKLAATHPAKATAACPEGIPPAKEFGEWVSALPRRTMSTITPSVTSVRWAGWRLMLSRVARESGPRSSARTR